MTWNRDEVAREIVALFRRNMAQRITRGLERMKRRIANEIATESRRESAQALDRLAQDAKRRRRETRRGNP